MSIKAWDFYLSSSKRRQTTDGPVQPVLVAFYVLNEYFVLQHKDFIRLSDEKNKIVPIKTYYMN